MLKTWIIWLLACYGFAVLLIHFWRKWGYFYQGKHPLRVQLLLHNSQSSLEWIVRSLMQKSRVEGRPVELTVYDYGSTDDTPKILQLMQRKEPFLVSGIKKVDVFVHGTSGNYELIDVDGSIETLEFAEKIFVGKLHLEDALQGSPNLQLDKLTGSYDPAVRTLVIDLRQNKVEQYAVGRHPELI